jgi:Lrp/AsnC family transcriptional regulator, leucine-responsive regulatory protein
VAVQHTCDALDRACMSLLQRNPRASYQELAEATGVAPTTVKRRIDRLLKSDAIKFIAIPSWLHSDSGATAMLALAIDWLQLTTIVDEASAIPELCWIAVTTDRYPITMQIAISELEDIIGISQRVAAIPGVRDIRVSSVIEFVAPVRQ